MFHNKRNRLTNNGLLNLDHATGTSSNRNTRDVNWAMKNPAPLRFIGRVLPTSTKYPFVISICQVNMDLAPHDGLCDV